MNLVPGFTAAPPPEPYAEPVHAYPQAPDDNAKIFLIDILAAIHRNRKLALAVGLLAAAAVILVTLSITPLYKSSASIMLDTRRKQVVDVQAVLSNLPSDTFVVDSEAQVLQSPDLARKVIARLNLAQDPEFNSALRDPSTLSSLRKGAAHGLASLAGWLGLAQPRQESVSPERREAAILQTFRSNLTIARQGLTYVINITFWSEDAGKARRIADAVAETYLQQQRDAKVQATQRANTLIQTRVKALQQQVFRAEQAVADYKSKHGLLNAVGAPLTEQVISALNTQMATAQAQEAEQAGRLAAARAQLQRNGSDGVGQAALSETVRQLRAQQAELITQEADLARRYGPRHPALIKVRSQRQALDTALVAEVQRVIGAQQAEASAAASRASSLRASIAKDRQQLAANNSAGVRLAELERDANAVRGVYESFLNRLKQTAAQEGLQEADAAIVSRASLPLQPSSPSWMLAAAIAAALALLAAGLAVLLREFFHRGVRSPFEAEHAVGLPVIATIPQIAKANPAAYVVQRPLSDFAEAIRNLRTSLFLSRAGTPPKIVALMSALPHEGKTTTALALGRQCAESGARVLIVDADLRRHALTAHLDEPVPYGLVELLEGRAPLERCLYRDPLSSAMILPVARGNGASNDLFFAHDLEPLFARLRERFDIILVDTAPLLPLAEPRVVAAHADAAVLLTHWHKTSQTAMQDAARLMRSLDVPIAGLVLTCADMKLLDSFGYSARSYGQRAGYARYYVP